MGNFLPAVVARNSGGIRGLPIRLLTRNAMGRETPPKADVTEEAEMSEIETDPNEINANSPAEPRDNGPNPGFDNNDRPYGDAGNLYEIPRVRSDDPPLRNWWTDDEPQKDGSHAQHNG